VVESSLEVLSPALQNLIRRVTRRSIGFVDGWLMPAMFNGFKGWTHAAMDKNLLHVIEDTG